MKLCHSVTVNLASAVMHFTWLNFMIQKPSSFNILALPIFNFFFILWFSTWYIWLLAVVWSILSSRCWFVCSQSIVNGINMQLKSHKFSQMYSPVSMMHVQRMHNTSYHIYGTFWISNAVIRFYLGFFSLVFLTNWQKRMNDGNEIK